MTTVTPYTSKDLAEAQAGDHIAWVKVFPNGDEITLYGTVNYFAHYRPDGSPVLHLSTPAHPYTDITGSPFTAKSELYQAFSSTVGRDYYAGHSVRLVFLHDAPEPGTVHPNAALHITELDAAVIEAETLLNTLDGYRYNEQLRQLKDLMAAYARACEILGVCAVTGCTGAASADRLYCGACSTPTPLEATR